MGFCLTHASPPSHIPWSPIHSNFIMKSPLELLNFTVNEVHVNLQFFNYSYSCTFKKLSQSIIRWFYWWIFYFFFAIVVGDVDPHTVLWGWLLREMIYCINRYKVTTMIFLTSLTIYYVLLPISQILWA